MPAFFALFSALFFGASDYLGGRLSRKQDAARVTGSSQFFVFFLYIILALVVPGKFSWAAIGFGLLGGISSVVGLNFFYSALAKGVVGVVASVTALLTASIPIFWSVFVRGEKISALFVIGALVAAGAIIFLALPQKKSADVIPDEQTVSGEPIALKPRHMTRGEWLRTITGGSIMSLSIISLSHTSQASGCWPLIGVGVSAIISSTIFTYVKSGSASIFVEKSFFKPLFAMVVSMGIAYVAQLYAARSGALAVASVIGALYPIPTILLAHFVDGEKLNRNQTMGVVLAVAAIVFIALS